ncbi:MAG: YihY/virulence factor BrkB family protein [Gammaproteobacteria bacterium]|nr:YihY/virulence factor BrkB family protein [Gammaproteobacteria bacterium]MBU1442375.1 YihY/virulence factor BrkB family protein [Gammaproteobacteria bacterium]MBU2285217.1 YihY/virulence factor BrkB family protein [Gammaproteobacteria bacterium]MBU2411012.1 YihY/virulence factor BrkB family protein [Gammaproteobacteria bacterium]
MTNDRAPKTDRFARRLLRKIQRDDIFNGAAALGFYLTLAIFPAVILTMAVIPYLPIEHVDQAIMDLLRQALPREASSMLTGVVRDVTTQRSGGLLSFGIAASLWATSTGMYAIMQQLNTTYDVEEGRGFFKGRLVAIGLSLLFIVLVIGAFSLIVLGGVLQDWVRSQLGANDAVFAFFALVRWLIIAVGLLLAFAIIYYLGPNVEQRFAFVSPGSVVGVLLLVAASLGFAWYVQSFGNYSATYGSIGAVIVLMLWLYISGLAILVGSEINVLVQGRAKQADSA